MNNIGIVKYVTYSIEILLALVIQGTPHLLPEIFGGKAILLIPLAVSIAVWEKQIPAVIFGAVCGLLIDSGYSGPIGFYAITLAAACCMISFLMENYIRTNLLTVMLAALIAIPSIIFLQFIFYYVLMEYDDTWGFFARHYISRMIYTIAVTPLFYGLNKFISFRLSAK